MGEKYDYSIFMMVIFELLLLFIIFFLLFGLLLVIWVNCNGHHIGPLKGGPLGFL